MYRLPNYVTLHVYLVTSLDIMLLPLPNIHTFSVADLGFPREDGQSYNLTNFPRISPKNCMKMNKFWGGGGEAPPLDPPLILFVQVYDDIFTVVQI